MNDTDFEQLGYHAVQFIGGYADGKELWVDELKPEYQWTILADLYDMLRNSDEHPDLPYPTKHAVYRRLRDSTVYVFKEIRY